MSHRSRLFRFIAAWVGDESCEEVILNAWRIPHEVSPIFSLCRKIQKSNHLLSRWNKECFRYCSLKITQILSIIDKIQKLEPSLENLIIEENLQRELDEWFHRDETLKR